MSSQSDDNQGVVFGILGAVVVMAVALAVGFGLGKRGPKAMPAAPPVAVIASDAVDGARVIVEEGVVKFYFASGKADLAAGASEALTDVVKGAQAGRKVAISGFHDATGNADQNAELAKQRALAVRDALTTAGVPESQIELKKPEQIEGSTTGSDAEARRVEISLQ